MKYLFVINTPAQYHFWKNIILGLMNDNQSINIIARDYESTCRLLEVDKLKYDIYTKPSSNKLVREYQIVPHVFNAHKLARRFHPDIIIGFGVVESFVSIFLDKPAIIYTDSENLPLQNYLIKLLAHSVLTPDLINESFGKNHIRIKSYKELAYLHPNYFQPDPAIFQELGIGKNEKYAILRLNAWDAVHDIGKSGFSVEDQIKLVERLKEYGKVFISPAYTLPKELEKYQFPISKNRIHHALYYAQLLVTDTQTMATEAAVLGTPVVRCNSWVGPNDNSIFKELEQKYGLIYSFREPEKALQKVIELITQPDIKEQWTKKRQLMLSEKTDITQFLIDFIKNYPKSLQRLKTRENNL
jgi:uncharacterized protein